MCMRIITNRTDNYPELNIYVDDEDFEYLNQFRWCVFMTCRVYYARTSINGKKYYMHRMIMNTVDNPDHVVDHIDGNGLNNTRMNLRVTTNRVNCRNKSVGSRNTSGVVGVSFNEGKWKAQIVDNNGKAKIKSFSTNKYGFEEAKKMAADQRKEWEVEFGYIIRY